MNLKYHKKGSKNNLVFKIFEQEPCRRTVFAESNYYNLPFPYIYFVLRYKYERRKYTYEGVHGATMLVFGSKNPLKSFSDETFELPFDVTHSGIFCSPHQYDGRKFDSPKELENFAISTWWNVHHFLGYFPFNSLGIWSKSEVKNAQWRKGNSMLANMNFAYQSRGLSNMSQFLTSENLRLNDEFEIS